MKTVLAAVLCLAALAGCADTSVATINGQGYATGEETKRLDCDDGMGRIAIGAQGAGSFSVRVTDGSGATVFEDKSVAAGQDGQAQTVRGEPGTWTLRVSTGFGYSGQYSVTLSC